ncbi:unnamed protein product [Moneuplotes crassus]|uniref:Transmembrane protein 198 n=1 Tax=Euplotes crassus TaxID=5936 RepID=A0AAD1XFP6_EUPCR|nr:unnamed protein product [Moneuplotes crassus]
MKATSIILLSCILAIAIAGELREHLASQFSVKCVHTLGFTFFNLEPLKKKGDGEFYTVRRELSDGKEYEVNFDFCETLPEVRACKDVNPMAVEYDVQEEFSNSCRQLTKHQGKNKETTLENTEGEDSDQFIEIVHTSSLNCKNDEKFGITFEIFCDEEKKEIPEFVENPSRSSDCRPVFRTHHYGGCKVGDLNALWRFVESNSIIFGIVAMFIGLYNLVLGRKFIKPTIGLIMLITVVAVIMFVFYVIFLPRDTAKWVGWLILSISIVLGGIAGFFSSKLVRIGVIVLGFWAGVGIGLLLNNLIFFRINHVSVLWVLMGVFGLAFAIMSFFWYNYIVIICTSILGSYFFVRGIALMAGGYPNEFTIYGNIASKTFEGMPATFWVYVASMVVACALGIFIQIKIKRRENKPETDDVYKRV